jgi:hypothetical protein
MAVIQQKGNKSEEEEIEVFPIWVDVGEEVQEQFALTLSQRNHGD